MLNQPLSRILDAFAPCHAGPGFTSVRWFGKAYIFSPMQAAIVGKLWEAWIAGSPDVHQSNLLIDVDSESAKIADLFRTHPAWNGMIVSIAKGAYRLQEPVSSDT